MLRRIETELNKVSLSCPNALIGHLSNGFSLTTCLPAVRHGGLWQAGGNDHSGFGFLRNITTYEEDERLGS